MEEAEARGGGGEPHNLLFWYKSLPSWAKVGLKMVIIVTLVVVLCMLCFYKGMLYQCNELGLVAYSKDHSWIGFECRERDRGYAPYLNGTENLIGFKVGK